MTFFLSVCPDPSPSPAPPRQKGRREPRGSHCFVASEGRRTGLLQALRAAGAVGVVGAQGSFPPRRAVRGRNGRRARCTRHEAGAQHRGPRRQRLPGGRRLVAAGRAGAVGGGHTWPAGAQARRVHVAGGRAGAVGPRASSAAGWHGAVTVAGGGRGGRGPRGGPGGAALGAALAAGRAAAAPARGALLPVAGDLHRGLAAGAGRRRTAGGPRGLPVQPAPRRELAEPPAVRPAGRPHQPGALPVRLLQPAAGPRRAAAAPARGSGPGRHRLRLHGPQRLADRSAPQGRYSGSARPGPRLHASQVRNSGQEGADHRLPQLDHASHSEQQRKRFDFGG
uniref:Phospholipase D family member 6 n=1 Tax=Equus caballus TaxID=9796 RepID=A0A3Q2H7B8_HORSE